MELARDESPVPHAPGLWVGVLGPLVVIRDGVRLPALPGGQRVVLGLLALAGGVPVQREALVDALWGEEPPRSATAIVQTYMSRLRSSLHDDGREYLPESDGSSYRLLTAPDGLDLLTFRRLAEGARAHQNTAAEAFEQALALWRGQPLADVGALQRHPAVSVIAAEYGSVVLDYADCGGLEALPHLRTLTTWDPLNEAAHARLMIALASAGRQADALRAYEEVRRRLDEELGVLPGPALRAAQTRVLRQELPVVSPGPAVRPSVRPADAWQPVSQLPAAPADFTGRAAECTDLISAIDPGGDHPGVPVVAISGPPGIGKTSLALYAMHTISARFPDGQLWVQLAGSSARPRDPGEVLGELLRALGLPGSAIPEDFSERAVCYRSRLAGRRVVVIADDAATAAQVRPLIPGTAGCALLVTSRSRMEDLDGAHLMPLDVLPAEDAAGLLGRIVGAQRVEAERDATGELVAACGALPLALRIAGAKLAARPSWPLAAMVRRLASKHDRLRELQAGDLSVRASIASSYESLPERPRRAFRLLALLGPGDFAEWVIGALLGEPDASDVTSELVSRSLLTPLSADATGEPRYRLHDLLREYAAEGLDSETADREKALERLLAGWLQLAQLADASLPPEPYFPPRAYEPGLAVVPEKAASQLTAQPIAWFTTERINLQAGVEQACMAGRLDFARQLASSQCAFQHIEDRHDDAERIWQMIAEWADRSDDRAAITYARLRVGASLVERGLAADAFPILGRCVATAAEAGESETLAIALYWRAACAYDVDEVEQAQVEARRGVGVARRAGSRLAELLNLRSLASSLVWKGEFSEAVAAAEQALTIATDLGVPAYELAALHSLAFTYVHAEQYDRAASACMRKIELSRELGDVRGEAHAYGVLGDVYHGQGKYDLTVESLLRALPVFRDHRAHRHYALCLVKIGFAYEQMAAYPQAIGYLEQSVAKFQDLRLVSKAEQAQQALDRCRAAIAPAS
jgi:DNA-binding SARP family transcriptional activator/tetratricopeptide (TPR) repeat protein